MPSRRSPLLSASLALLLVTGFAAAATPPGTEAREEEDKFVLENDQLTIWFQGKKPLLKLFPAERPDEAFAFHALRVIEFEDVDGDGAPSEAETRAFLNLQGASAWNVTTGTRDDLTLLSLTLAAPLTVKGPLAGTPVDPIVNRDARGNVTFVFRLAPQAVTLTGAQGPLTLLPTETKFDFLVNQWSWRDGSRNLLALVYSAGETHNATLVEGEDRAVLEGEGNTTRGYFAWEPTARAMKGGALYDVGVNAVPMADEERHHALVYNQSGFTSLLHDPVLGASATGAPEGTEAPILPGDLAVPGAGAVGAVAVAGAVAALGALRRGRQDG